MTGDITIDEPRDHRDVVVDLARRHGWKRGVELGLGQGLLFERLLGCGVEMVGVDLGLRADRWARISARCVGLEGRCHVLQMPTAHAVDHVADGWADFVFIDAAHGYEAVRQDIRLWEPKVRPGGWFGGHDYHPKFPGVVRAVDELLAGRFEVLPHFVWARI